MNRHRFVVTAALLVLLAASASADWVVDTVRVDSSVSSAVVNPITNKVFALGAFGRGVVVIDGVTHGTTTVPDGNPFPAYLVVGCCQSLRSLHPLGRPARRAARLSLSLS